MNNKELDFTMTMIEVRTVMTILQTLVDRSYLPLAQHQIVLELLKKMKLANMGERN